MRLGSRQLMEIRAVSRDLKCWLAMSVAVPMATIAAGKLLNYCCAEPNREHQRRVDLRAAAWPLVPRLRRGRLQLEELMDYFFQALEVDGLRQVLGEPRFTCLTHVVLHSEATQGDAAQAFRRL